MLKIVTKAETSPPKKEDFLTLPKLNVPCLTDASVSLNISKNPTSPYAASPNSSRKFKLRLEGSPPKTKEYTLVLDLDETLVNYCDKIRDFQPRPYARKFLKHMSKSWEIIVFTAGLKDYADRIIDVLDPNRYI